MYLRLILIFVVLASLVKFTQGLHCYNCIENKGNFYGCIQTKFVYLKELGHQIDRMFSKLSPQHLFPKTNNDQKQRKLRNKKRFYEILSSYNPHGTDELLNLVHRKVKTKIPGMHNTLSKPVDSCQITTIGDYVIRSGEDLDGRFLDFDDQCNITVRSGLRLRKCWCTTEYCNDRGLSIAGEDTNMYDPSEEEDEPKEPEKDKPNENNEDKETENPEVIPIDGGGEIEGLEDESTDDQEILNNTRIVIPNGNRTAYTTYDKMSLTRNGIKVNGQVYVMSNFVIVGPLCLIPVFI